MVTSCTVGWMRVFLVRVSGDFPAQLRATSAGSMAALVDLGRSAAPDPAPILPEDPWLVFGALSRSRVPVLRPRRRAAARTASPETSIEVTAAKSRPPATGFAVAAQPPSPRRFTPRCGTL